MRNRWAIATLVGLGILGGVAPVVAAELPAAGPEECFIVADGNAEATDGRAPDLLTRITRADRNPETNEVNVGTGTGTFNIEAIALQPGTGVLFATDSGTLGTIDVTTGVFTAKGPIGVAQGVDGEQKISDVDGLSFDPATGFLYGTERISGSGNNDLLIRINPDTGAIVPAAFPGADYLVIPGVADLPDIDDIAIDPVDSRMYGVANDDGRKDHLVVIDKLTGATTDIGVLEAQDVEGLGFASGQLIGTTGKVFKQEGIWDIDKATGAASNRRPLDNAMDYEGFDCLNPPTTPAAPPPAPEPEPEIALPPRAPQAIEQPVVVAPEVALPTVAAPPAELPRTGPSRALLLTSGLALALGGACVGGSARRRRLNR